VDAEELAEAARVMETAQAAEARLTDEGPGGLPHAGWTQRADRTELSASTRELTAAWSGKPRPGRTSKRPSSPPPSAPKWPLRPDWRGKYTDIVGQSEAITGVLGVLDKVAPSDAMVLIRGESGTGKELVAAAIHANSPRRDKPSSK
jgi:transcriptional regulator with GAF, ATPase, and Fis domain